MAESIAQGLHHVAHESITGETNEDLFHDTHLELQERMRNPIAFHAKMMGDIMYLNQALQQSDTKEFIQAVVKEVNGHVDCNNWTLKKRSEVPDDAHFVPSVWSMRRKHDLTTNQVVSQGTIEPPRWKANLRNELFRDIRTCCDMVCYQTYDHIRNHFGWYLRQVDFVMAYPQAPIEMNIYMELPQGIMTAHGNS